MTSTFQNSAQVLSIGVFFTLIIVGLSASLPSTLFHGLVAHGVPASVARDRGAPATGLHALRRVPGSNPIDAHRRPPRCWLAFPRTRRRILTGRRFFPGLISVPFAHGLHEAFDFSIGMCLIAAATSWLRGGKYHYPSPDIPASADEVATMVPDA